MKHQKVEQLAYNMIEIMVAMAIIVVILVSVMSLLPKSMQSNQEAVNRMTAADTADQFLNLMSSRIENNWSDLTAIPTEKNETDESELIFSSTSLLGESDTQVFYEAPSSQTGWDPTVCNKGVFKVRQMTGSSKMDFEGMVRCWKADNLSATTGANSATLYAEVSWPTSIPMDQRRSKIYEMKVYQPQAAKITELAITEVPCRAAWAVDDSGPSLYYYTLHEDATTTSTKEGDIVGMSGSAAVEAVAVAPGGSIYFMNNHASEPSCTLYKISPGQIDGSSTTSVSAVRIGETGISNSTSSRIQSMTVVDGKLYAIGQTDEKIYQISFTTGAVSEIGTLGMSGTRNISAMTVGRDGYVYFAQAKASNSIIHRFDVFPAGPITEIATVNGSNAIRTLTAHPTGWLYAHDKSKVFRVEPVTGLYEEYMSLSSTVDDMDFYYQREVNDCYDEDACKNAGDLKGQVGLNPTGSGDFGFTMTTVNYGDVTRDSLLHRNAPVDTLPLNVLVTYIRFTVKVGGPQTGTTLDGEAYQLDTNVIYEIVSTTNTPFRVILDNSSPSMGVAMGQWTLDITEAPLQISFCDQTLPE